MFAIHTPPPMTKTLRVLAALLGYPDAALRGHLTEMNGLLQHERALPFSRCRELELLMARIEAGEALDVEADYVELFDRGRATSLHLFEHVHGDSRERGPAMIDLGQTYEAAGLVLAEGELPDYLPAVLEFVSTQPAREARAFLGEMSHILNALFGALQHQGSGYASVLGALLELAGETATPVAPPVEPPLDDSWAEPVVFDACSSTGQARPGQPRPIKITRRGAGEQASKGASA